MISSFFQFPLQISNVDTEAEGKSNVNKESCDRSNVE